MPTPASRPAEGMDVAGRLSAWRLMPVACGLVAVLLSLTPIPTGTGASTTAPVALIVTVFWTVHRPADMPAAAATFLGLCLDLLTAGPFGINALGLLTVQLVMAGQQRVLVRISFPLQWFGFTVVALAHGGLLWLTASVVEGTVLDLSPMLVRTALALGLYPVLARLVLYPLHRVAQ